MTDPPPPPTDKTIIAWQRDYLNYAIVAMKRDKDRDRSLRFLLSLLNQMADWIAESHPDLARAHRSDVLMHQTDLASEAGNHQEAIELSRRGVELWTPDDTAFALHAHDLTMAYLKNGQFDEACTWVIEMLPRLTNRDGAYRGTILRRIAEHHAGEKWPPALLDLARTWAVEIDYAEAFELALQADQAAAMLQLARRLRQQHDTTN